MHDLPDCDDYGVARETPEWRRWMATGDMELRSRVHAALSRRELVGVDVGTTIADAEELVTISWCVGEQETARGNVEQIVAAIDATEIASLDSLRERCRERSLLV